MVTFAQIYVRMISVNEALGVILQNPLSFPTEEISLDDAFGRVLREPIVADRDFPPFDRVTMDGIAIDYETFEKGIRIFPIQEVQAAGSPPARIRDVGNAIEVMTGAVCPEGTDTVIRYEDLEFNRYNEPHMVRLVMDNIQRQQNVHFQGLDRKKGEILVPAGVVLGAPETGIAATVGKARVKVVKLPKVAIISTGDEIVGIDETPLLYQIRSSNAQVIGSSLRQLGVQSRHVHINDDQEATKSAIASLLETYEVLILSGGVSKGKFDYVPGALEEMGVKKHFHRVAQRPGKPFWFGMKEDTGRAVFALPGNPVSTFVNYLKYFQPWLRTSLGLPATEPLFATLKEDFHFNPPLTYFLQVKVESNDQGQLTALPVEGHGSGDHANLLDCNGFLELPADRNEFSAGETFPLILYRSLGQ